MKSRLAFLAFPIALGLFGCSDSPVAPHKLPGGGILQQAAPKGTGLAVDIVPNVKLPLGLGGSVTIDQAVITNFALVENVVGQIVGLQVTGTLSGTAVNAVGGLVGVDAQPFTATANVTSSGPGQCNLATIDLMNPTLNVLGLATGTIPVNVTAKGSGAVGSLLCNLGQALAGIGSALSGGGAQGLVNALNNQIG
ncbi:MAG: hypothetical protein JF602_02800 [Gemmatimonadetes bacterium]|jgi:hypothetical protein|nr:hypothetical protein [Gemmatimonadota bacterium]